MFKNLALQLKQNYLINYKNTEEGWADQASLSRSTATGAWIAPLLRGGVKQPLFH